MHSSFQNSLLQAVWPPPVSSPGWTSTPRSPLAGAPGSPVVTWRAQVAFFGLHLAWCWNTKNKASNGSLPENHSCCHSVDITFWRTLSKTLLLLRPILLSNRELMVIYTYFCDHLVQTVFQFAGHIPTSYWGYKGHLQHLEHLQTWSAVKDTLDIRW